MAHRLYPRNLPSIYATEKLPTGRSRLAGALGAAIARATSVAAPGVPVAAWLGFASNGDTNEVTDLGEVGSFGTMTRDLPALRADPIVRQILGRPADDWRALPDQAAMGVVDLVNGSGTMAASLAPGLRPSSGSSPWAVVLGILDWTHPTNARSMIRRHPEIAAVPEASRWSSLYRAVAEDAAAGRIRLANDHSSEAYTALRTQQKLEAARALGTGFFGPGDPAADEVLARLVTGQPASFAPPASGTDDFAIMVLVTTAATLGVLAVLRRSRR